MLKVDIVKRLSGMRIQKKNFGLEKRSKYARGIINMNVVVSKNYDG